jgi:glycosyltransferase involved in cell wall biosynthesis
MRIALIAPPFFTCPPVGYGGTELVVANLANGLVERGHDVTLFAHRDSKTRAALHPSVDIPQETFVFPYHREVLHVADAFENLGDADIIHSHTSAALCFERLITKPMITTIHGLTDMRTQTFHHYRSSRFVSVSDNAQRTAQPGLNWIARIYNGIDVGRYRPRESATRDYLVHLNALCERKGTAEAVQIARRAGVPLILAGPIYDADQAFFEEHVEPFVDGKSVRYVGVVAGEEKIRLLAGALGLLVPIRFHEPFGLVMAESLSCGVPVIVNDIGSARELVRDGETGFVCSCEDDAVEAIGRLSSLSPTACREAAVRSFSVDAMVSAYEDVYASVLKLRDSRLNGPVGSRM